MRQYDAALTRWETFSIDAIFATHEARALPFRRPESAPGLASSITETSLAQAKVAAGQSRGEPISEWLGPVGMFC